METIQSQCGHGAMAGCLNADVHGAGLQTLVLAHGFGWNQTGWQYLVPYLACYYFKVVVFDLAFAGTVRQEIYDEKKYSTFDGYAQDVIHLREEMDVSHSVYLGHSISAMIDCLAAPKKPHLFKQLILWVAPKVILVISPSIISTSFLPLSINFEATVKYKCCIYPF